MANDQPDNVTGDSTTIARVHAFLVALLSFLGFNAAQQNETISSALDTLESWLDGAKKIRRDPQGATARVWWDMFKAVMLESRGKREYAAQIADEAIDEFGRRFLPVAEDERDTLNTADFDAIRAELDQADRYRGEIADAIDGNAGERQWLHARLIDELRAERDALLKTNAHHASEVDLLRKELYESNASVILARSERDAIKQSNVKYLDEMAQLANALDGVRAAILAPSLPDEDVPRVIRMIVEERNQLHIAICDANDMPHTGQFDKIAAVAALRKECDALKAQVSYLEKLRTIGGDGHETERSFWTTVISGWEQCTGCATPNEARDALTSLRVERDALKSQLASAIVPLPKPRTVSIGQLWQRKYFVIDLDHRIDPIGLTDDARLPLDFQKMLTSKDWVYLGTEER